MVTNRVTKRPPALIGTTAYALKTLEPTAGLEPATC
jgi:hypothetical protein